MFDFDALLEIFATIKKNRLRTFLTGFSIAWGIFMLILLLAAGNGLRHGITSNFASRAQNTIGLWDGSTTKPFKGLPVDRQIKFDSKDIELILSLPETQYISPYNYKQATISFDEEYGSWSLQGVYPDAKFILNPQIIEGRFINQIDLDNKRKVIVINTEMRDVLFKKTNPIGKYVMSENITYKVVGLYEDQSGRTNVPAFIPFSTGQSLYNRTNKFNRIEFTVLGLKTIEQNQDFIENFRKQMGALHSYDPDDKSAIWINNRAEDIAQTEAIFGGINMFIWVIGLLSLMAGVVGISNIMLITVKERTREFGIRKAIGAKPSAILRLVLLESVLITTFFGYVGMFLGLFLSQIAKRIIEMNAPNDGGPTIFKNPTVDLDVAIYATLVLIIAGVIAGYIPAKRAVSIRPVEAMRAE